MGQSDGFFYDMLHLPDGRHVPLKVRSMVGLIPLFAVETLEPRLMDQLPGFKRRMDWFIANRPDLTRNVASMVVAGKGERRLLSIVNPEQLRVILKRMLDEQEFLSPFGIRSLSRAHKDKPYEIFRNGVAHAVGYEPGESTTGLFGGNSNWRGPVWFPLNYLLIESLQKFHHYLGDDFKVECPTGSGKMMTLWQVAADISRRLARLFLKDEQGRRPVHGDIPAICRSGTFLRVLSRRERPRTGRQPSDRLDRASGETPAAKRGVNVGGRNGSLLQPQFHRFVRNQTVKNRQHLFAIAIHAL